MNAMMESNPIDEIPAGNLFELPVSDAQPVIFHGIVSGNKKLLSIFDDIERIATANVPIFVTGETGTGKELAARACHDQGFDSNKPFIAVNCANFSEQLMESQLFGHKKGAFTDASRDQAGLFESAGEGTLFLDEVTTLSLPLQAKLLRVIQEREFSPLGSHKLKPFKARIVTASSVSLADAVAAGEFREDLYYRLGVVTISLPALRDRGNDSQLLAQYFLENIAETELQGQDKDACFFTKDALDFIASYEWPGNVRQLRNVILGTLVLSTGYRICADSLRKQVNERINRSTETQAQTVNHESRPSNVSEIQPSSVQPLWLTEKAAIERAIAFCDGNIPRAASLLEVSPSTLYRKIQVWEAA